MSVKCSRRMVSLRARNGGLLAISALIVIVAMACGSDTSGSADSAGSQPTQTTGEVSFTGNAPPLSGETFNHGPYSLDDSTGRPVLINFWFPSCPPCRAEMPDLQAAYEDFGDDIDFIGVQQVGLDTKQDGINFLNEVGVTYPNLVDEGLRIQSAYQVFAYPTTIFLDGNHDIFRTWSGPLTEDNLRDLIEAVIAG